MHRCFMQFLVRHVFIYYVHDALIKNQRLSGGTRNFLFVAIAEGIPQQLGPDSRGEAPVEAEAVCGHCLQILTAEMIKI